MTQQDHRPVARILMVEDNPDNQMLIHDILSNMDYEILLATDGREGVTRALAEHPDLILMDMSLPAIDGWKATAMIRAEPSMAGVKIVAVTAHAMVGDRDKAIAAGCDDYISKPIDFIELKAVIARLLDDRRA